MLALVIGADGFAGRWLIHHLLDSGDDVVPAVGPRFSGRLPSNLKPTALDVTRSDRVLDVIQHTNAEVIYYLAGVSAPDERADIDRLFAVSFRGAIATMTAASTQKRKPRVILVGSSHVYGIRPFDHAVVESDPLRPTTAYGAMKAAAEVAGLALGRTSGVDIIAARPFNHIGPGQKSSFVAPALASQVARIRASGKRGVIRAGSLDVRRDFSDVRDVVRAYRQLAESGEAYQPYNIGSGKPVSIREIVEALLDLAGVEADVVSDEELARPGEPTEISANASKLHEITGWSPRIPLRQTLVDLLASVEVSTTGAQAS